VDLTETTDNLNVLIDIKKWQTNYYPRDQAYEDDGAIRFKVPQDGSVDFKDYVRGEHVF
jgi:hypothetical protein